MQIFPLMKRLGFVKTLDGFQVPAIAKIEKETSLRHGAAQNYGALMAKKLTDSYMRRSYAGKVSIEVASFIFFLSSCRSCATR